MESYWFSKAVVTLLNDISIKTEPTLDFSRYGWLPDDAIKVIKTMSLPLSDERDPVEIPFANLSNGNTSDNTYLIYFLVGACITVLIALIVVLYLHMRLKTIYSALEKDKQLSGVATIKSMWNK
jgi:hypothetical protein